LHAATRARLMRALAGAVVAALLAACGGPAAQGPTASGQAGAVSLLETGSTLLYPLFNLWVAAYQQDHPGVRITTQGTGSGAGIAAAIQGTAQIGASDAYMADAQVQQHPDILNIPLAIAAQVVAYNLPGLGSRHLNLSGPVLAGIYQGKITKWNDPAIAAQNPGLQLPDATIVPVHRTDGSGDTFLFTQYLSFSDPDGWGKAIGYNVSVSFPAVPGALGANGNPGMVQALKQTPYAVAYVGISYLDQLQQAGAGYAALQNRAGQFVLPTPQTIAAAAAAVTTPKDERVSLIFAPGQDAYPIVNYEYAVVSTHQGNAAQAKALKDFLAWAIRPDGGGAARFLDPVHFVALPPAIVQLSQAQIDRIGG
jgi:phosphate transport system substrate-binding protein